MGSRALLQTGEEEHGLLLAAAAESLVCRWVTGCFYS